LVRAGHRAGARRCILTLLKEVQQAARVRS
jgi:hypothetical protein